MTAPRLSAAMLDALPDSVRLPDYDRSAVKSGILHLGLGAFHRAHQAVYTDTVLANDPRWGIVGVSLRSERAAAQLNPQQGLFSVLSEDAGGHELRVIGAVQQVLMAPREPDALDAAFSDPGIHIVTLTVTEAGYCLASDGCSLDSKLPAIQSDLANPLQASTAIGVLARGLKRRLDAHGAPLTIISCDNLGNNSTRLRGALTAYLELSWPEVLPWLEAQLRFPCSMVDRIVPAQTEISLARQAELLGARDEAAIATEPFSQWIIERDFATPMPDWEAAGAVFVDDIAPYEEMKLRLLNASHSAIAILGLLKQQETVADVMADQALRKFIEQLMAKDLLSAIQAPAGFDLHSYRDALLARFSNVCLQHRCAQIAMDCTEKLRQRWLPTLAGRGENRRLLKALAAWCYLVVDTEIEIDDPRRDRLLAVRTSDAPVSEQLTALMDSLGMDTTLQQRCMPLLQAHYVDLKSGSPPTRG